MNLFQYRHVVTTMSIDTIVLNDSSAPLRGVKKVQFGILSPEEIVSDAFRTCRIKTLAREHTWLIEVCNRARA